MPRPCVICSFVSIIAVLIGFSVAAPEASATAMVVPQLTGSAVATQSSSQPFGSFSVTGASGFASVPPIHAGPPPLPQCQPVAFQVTSCSWTWSGPFNAGFGFHAFVNGLPAGIDFFGGGTGTFSGQGFQSCQGLSCQQSLSETTSPIAFTGGWSNGWFSEGSFTGTLTKSIRGAQIIDNYRYAGPMETFTSRPAPIPEPSTFMMLGLA